jgi:hypothetical protein
MQSAQVNHITAYFRIKQFPKYRTRTPKKEKAVIFVRLGFSYTLPKKICDTYACQKTKFTASENYRLASRGNLVPFRTFKLNVKKKKIGSCLRSRYEEQIVTR